MYTLKSNTRAGIRFTFHGADNAAAELEIPYVAEYQMMNASLAYFTMKKLESIHRIPEGQADFRHPENHMAVPDGNGHGRSHH